MLRVIGVDYFFGYDDSMVPNFLGLIRLIGYPIFISLIFFIFYPLIKKSLILDSLSSLSEADLFPLALFASRD